MPVILDPAADCPFEHVIAAMDAIAGAKFTKLEFRAPGFRDAGPSGVQPPSYEEKTKRDIFKEPTVIPEPEGIEKPIFKTPEIEDHVETED